MSGFHWAAAALAAALATGSAQAEITLYTSYADWSAHVTGIGTDTFDDLVPGEWVKGPLARTVGAYSYEVLSGPMTPFLWPVGSAGDTWLSNDDASDVLFVREITPLTTAVGGYFFGTDFGGAWTPGSVLVTVTDITTEGLRHVVSGAPTDSFVGFVSTVPIASIRVTTIDEEYVWPTMNNLSFAVAVPEPATVGLWMLGLAGVAGSVRCRRV